MRLSSYTRPRLAGQGLGALRSGGAVNERSLAGMLSGLLFLTGATSGAAILVLPGSTLPHWRSVLVLAGVSGAWGLACLLVVPWRTAAGWVTHASTSAGLLLTASAIAATGGVQSPTRFYLFFAVVLAGAFYRPGAALAYLLACGAVHALPLLYDPQAVGAGFLRELLVVVPAYLVLGGALVWGKRMLVSLCVQAETSEAEHRRLAAEQGALRRVATAVAAGEGPQEVYRLISEEAARLMGASASGLLRMQSAREMVVVGSWSLTGDGLYEPGTQVPVRAGGDLEEMLTSGCPVRVERHLAGSAADQLGYACTVVAPVCTVTSPTRATDSTWGVLALASPVPAGLPEGVQDRLSDFAHLLATAIANTEHRAKLAAQATSDPLTGLLNHRVFHEHLRAEVSRTRRHGGNVSLAVIDIDHFKELNDGVGHDVGDRILSALADRLSRVARAEDTVARIGGDEFALLLPETDRLQGLSVVERLRRLVAAEPLEGRSITLSAGICDMAVATGPESLLRLADGALYWSKVHGRDRSWIYDSEVVHDLSAQERADHLQRSQALTGLRALARAIDARDPTTRRHSERVAVLASLLAEQRGWPADRIALLREAALIHDVGKIGVPDAVLLKIGPLTAGEREQVELHAVLSAQIAEEVLGAEQVDWVRAHHERPDGEGYPARLTEDDIPEGAALLALADSWDVMTVSRPYSVPKAPAAALRECEALSDRQFTASSVVALMALDRAGTLASLSGESESPATGSRPVAERRGGEPVAARSEPTLVAGEDG